MSRENISPEEWSRIRQVFGKARETPEPERARLLDSMSEGDADLRAIVERLLEGDDEPSWESPLANLVPAAAGLVPGDTVANYRVEAVLGQGGMGVVYRAEDLKLGRHVALKFLLWSDAELPEALLRRFEREARAASCLNHPNICTIYGLEQIDGRPAIVMELIEGETLASRLARGPMLPAQAVALGVQMAGALAEAHRKGIVHRDLKPENVMLTKSGVKILDFGLAKMERPMLGADHNIHQPGLVIGTLRYMSPEQAQGKETDARTDIFSFGVMLYEMFAGRRPFEGESAAGTVAAILEREPAPLDDPALDRLVRRCLAKDPDERWQSALDLATNLEWLPATATAPTPRRPWLSWSVAATLAAGLATVLFLHFTERRPLAAEPLRFQLAPPPGGNIGTLLNLSPDGQKLAFIANRRLWVHFFATGESRNLTDARGTPFWSPDSRFIAYAIDGKLKRIEATGGPAQTVADYGDPSTYGGGSWSRNDWIVFSNGKALFRVSAAGGTPEQIAQIDLARDEIQVSFPYFLPDGRHFLYTRRPRDGTKSAIYIGSVDANPEQQISKPLVNSFWHPVYVPSADQGIGYLLFMRGETLMAQPFDNRRLELTGLAAPVAEKMGDGRGFSASASGVLVYEPNHANNRQLTWYDRNGKVLGTIGDPGFYRVLDFSPDGTRVAVHGGANGEAFSIWLLDLLRGTSERFASGSASYSNPVWSPDGSRLVFSSNPGGVFDLYQEPVNRAKDVEPLLKSDEDKRATGWSPDGHFLLYTTMNPKTKYDIWMLPLDGDRKPIPFLVTPFNEEHARFSPDGRWVAYDSDESGSRQVYVRSFSMNAARTGVVAGGKWQISTDCGVDPRWRGDRRELFYYTCDGYVMAVDLVAGREFKPGPPHRLGIPQQDGAWGASLDGRRFLALAPDDKPEPYTVVLNWQSGLKK